MGDCGKNNEKCCCPCHAQHEKEECCHHGEECCHHGEEKHEEWMGYFLEAADGAWMEVLKDKIKEHILATQKDHITELAKIISEGNSQRWKFKMEKKRAISDFKEKLCRFFGQSKK
jgi:hypothetical protein